MKIIVTVIASMVWTTTSFAYYQAEQGRWISRDPIGEKGGINLNAFVANDGINKTDNLGLTDMSLRTAPGTYNPANPSAFSPTAPPSTGSAGAGIGGYFVFGAEASYSKGNCCENKIKYDYSIITICTGLGVAASLGPDFPSASLNRNNSSKCPETRYYVKLVGSAMAGVGYEAGGYADTLGPGLHPTHGLVMGPEASIGVKYVFCSDTVSKQKTGCCK